MSFVDSLLKWYEGHKRDLPWRRTQNPYFIWISEVMLQQTQVEKVIPFYHRFIQQFPDLESLAKAQIEEIFQVWSGLGYYRRASYLKSGALILLNQFGGLFPQDPKLLIKIPGFGPYTTGALLSIAFDIPIPAVDGNVLRVFSRLKTPTHPSFIKNPTKFLEKELIPPILPDKKAGQFNQALMELGALICKPLQPKCQDCPLPTYCQAFQNDKISQFPLKKKGLLRVKTLKLSFLFQKKGGEIAFKKNLKGEGAENLFELPFIEAKEEETPTKNFLKNLIEKFFLTQGLSPSPVKFLDKSSQGIVNRAIRMNLYQVEKLFGKKELNQLDWTWSPIENLERLLPLSAGGKRWLNQIKNHLLVSNPRH